MKYEVLEHPTTPLTRSFSTVASRTDLSKSHTHPNEIHQMQRSIVDPSVGPAIIFSRICPKSIHIALHLMKSSELHKDLLKYVYGTKQSRKREILRNAKRLFAAFSSCFCNASLSEELVPSGGGRPSVGFFESDPTPLSTIVSSPPICRPGRCSPGRKGNLSKRPREGRDAVLYKGKS